MKLAAMDLNLGPVVEPSSVLAYLRAGPWVKLDEHRNRGRHVSTLFENQHHDVEVHVPVWLEALDYSRRLAEAINAIASAEQRPPTALLGDLRAARFDGLRLHGGDAPLSLPRYGAMLTAARELLTSAALATAPRPRDAEGPIPTRVAALLEQVTLGAVEADGVVRVLVPVSSGAVPSAEPVPHAAEAGPRPLGRRVTEALARMLTRAQHAAAQAVAQGSLEPIVAQGVSPQLCRALAAAGAPLTVEVAWALTMPRPAPAVVAFTADELAVLAETAARLPGVSP